MAKKNEFLIFVPREILQYDIDCELKMGVLMAYCWIKKFGTVDGYYHDTLKEIMINYGLHFDCTKNKNYPKQINVFLKGLDYLKDKNAFTVIRGDYHKYDEVFYLKINNDWHEKKYISLNFKYFDYILNIKKRTNKMGMLYCLIFILSCYYTKDGVNGKEYRCACSYSLDKMAEKTGLSQIVLHNYLKNLSIEENKKGNAPLMKSRLWHITINNQIIRFPNIYVENTEDALLIINNRREEIRNHFRSQDKLDTSLDYDNYYDDDIY